MPPSTTGSPTRSRHARRVLAAAVLLWASGATLAPAPARAAAPEWPAVADEQEIHVLTRDEDGATRETTIWLLVQDGRGYIRTGGSTWGDNAVRAGEVVLRIRGRDHPLAIELVTDADEREQVRLGFREKYGLSDLLVTPIRGSNPRIMRLEEH